MNFSDLKKNLTKDSAKLPKIRVALCGDTSTQFLAIAIKGMGYERGYDLEMFEADFDQVEMQTLVPDSELNRFNPEILIVFQSSEKLLSTYNRKNPGERDSLASERIHFIETLCETNSAKIIYYNYPEINDTVFGSFGNHTESSYIYQVRKLNYSMMELKSRFANFFICDLSSIQNKAGRNTLFEPFFYLESGMVLSTEILPCVASRTMDIICAMQGKIRKCLIFDLDNTIWGGIIGDDGLENIQIGQGLGKGKCFTEIQHWIKKLKERGIILAVCSKNTESNAKEPFEKHPGMVLSLDDIAVFVANWENKPDNIKLIRDTLDIGFDSMVFLDDSPFEREIVHLSIPEITVPDLPEDPAEYLEFLYGLNLFETISYSEADSGRTLQYQTEAKRKIAQKGFRNEKDFLLSLNMVSDIKPFTKFNTPRIAQLSQRSNQFNLRTIRFTEAEIERIMEDDHYVTFSFTLEDKFGDNGLICAVILEKESDDTLFINTWFMSCRVLKRGMENLTLNVIARYASDNGYKTITGEYIATQKNSIVEDLYKNLGFTRFNKDKKALYRLDVSTYKEKETQIATTNK